MRDIKFRAWDKDHNDMWSSEDLKEEEISIYPTGEVTGTFNNFEIMQYTGLKDKNGKEIYENDRLKQDESIIQIVWSGRGFEGRYINKSQVHDSAITNNNYYQWEIIGNIYET